MPHSEAQEQFLFHHPVRENAPKGRPGPGGVIQS